MSILIKGMEMPDSCFLCRFCRRQEYGEYVGKDTAWSCVASKKRITDGQDLIATFKHPDCPLVEAAEVPDAQTDRNAQERYEDLCEYFKDCLDKGMGILGDRNEFKAWLERVYWHVVRCDELGRELEKLQSAQPERKKGKWIKIPQFCGDDVSGFVDNHFSCSECKKEAEINPWGFYILSDYCPNCGADMRGEQE